MTDTHSPQKDELVQIFKFVRQYAGSIRIIRFEGIKENFLLCLVVFILLRVFFGAFARGQQKQGNTSNIVFGVLLTVLLFSSGIYQSWITLNALNLYERQETSDIFLDEDLKYLYDKFGIEASPDLEQFIGSKVGIKELKAMREIGKWCLVTIKTCIFLVYYFVMILIPFLSNTNELLMKWYQYQTNQMFKKSQEKKGNDLSILNLVMEVNPAIAWHVALCTIYFFTRVAVLVFGKGNIGIFPTTPDFEILLVCDIMQISLAFIIQILFNPRMLNLYSDADKMVEDTSAKKSKFSVVDLVVGLKLNSNLGYYLSLFNALKMAFDTFSYTVRFYSQLASSIMWIVIMQMLLDKSFFEPNIVEVSEIISPVQKIIVDQSLDHLAFDDRAVRILIIFLLIVTNFSVRIMFDLPLFPFYRLVLEKIKEMTKSAHELSKKTEIPQKSKTTTTKTTKTTTKSTTTSEPKKKKVSATTPKAAKTK